MASRILRLRLLKADHIIYNWFKCCEKHDCRVSPLIERAVTHYLKEGEYLYLGTIFKPDQSVPVPAGMTKNISIPKDGVLDKYFNEHPDVNKNHFLKKILSHCIIITSSLEEEYIPGRYEELKPVMDADVENVKPMAVPVLSTKEVFSAKENADNDSVLTDSEPSVLEKGTSKESESFGGNYSYMDRILGNTNNFGW